MFRLCLLPFIIAAVAGSAAAAAAQGLSSHLQHAPAGTPGKRRRVDVEHMSCNSHDDTIPCHDDRIPCGAGARQHL
jgi:hypothetical protein